MKAYFKRLIISLVFILSIMNSYVYSQGTDARRGYVKKDKFYIGLFVSPAMTNITNENFSVSSPLINQEGKTLSYAFDFGYFFSKSIGLNLAAKYGSYSSKLLMDNISINYESIDSENENFEMRISGNSIIEDQTISFLSIPLSIILRFPAGEKLGFFIKSGLSFNIPLTRTYTGSGTFTYDGYYPAYPVLLQDLPEYGFPSNLNTNESGNLEIKSLSTALLVSAGVSYYLNETMEFLFSAQLNKSLSNISDYQSDPDYRLTSQANELNSIMGGSSKVGFQALGLNLGFRYYLK